MWKRPLELRAWVAYLVGFLGVLCLALPPASRIAAVAGQYASIEGRASVIDGDTVEVHGTRVRLHGIDAPESQQLCSLKDSQYRCGQMAALALSDHIGQRSLSCSQTDIDRYGRMVAVCRLDEEDIGAWLVLEGWALAYRRYSRDYINFENQAKAAGRGVWRGTFVAPWAWRRGERLPGGTADPPWSKKPSTLSAGGNCLIKGNISRDGTRIYHMPGQQHYDRTLVNEAKGERWFCSEADAQGAGWRRAKR